MGDEAHSSGIRTRVLLQISVALVIASTIGLSLYVVRSRLQQQVQQLLRTDLQHSVETFQDLEARRRSALDRENRLLATLPTLRSLMTTHDARTIADEAVDFWKTGGNDLFALTDRDGYVIAANAAGLDDHDRLASDLDAVLRDPAKHYLLCGQHLYEFARRPIFFGSEQDGTLLGYVVSGYAVDRRFLLEVGRGAGAEAMFVADRTITVSTLPKLRQNAVQDRLISVLNNPEGVLRLDGERYLTITRDLTGGAGVPLRLVLLKSFQGADRAEREINRLVLLAGLLTICVGAILMIVPARMLTRPLEVLATGVKAFANGDRMYELPSGGPQEVRYLSYVFGQMRDEIQKKNRALVEAERLATIGRMASSVSHDLRHYLAAVYANAEFLASPDLPAEERASLFEEIRLAVNGTTDMLDALLLFGNTGSAVRRLPTAVAPLVGRAVSLARAHPDAERVTLRFSCTDGDDTAAVDTRQMERAVYNLLLNACQATHGGAGVREVDVAVEADQGKITVTVTDTGAGVPDEIRDSLFDAFVSRGKQKGTGLGLTLAWSVAREHDGSIELVRSRPGETVFRLSLPRLLSGGADGPVSPNQGRLVAP